MMENVNPDDLPVDVEEEEQQSPVHDQLPAPEEARMSSPSPRVKAKKSTSTMDVGSIPVVFPENNDGNQLPSVEEAQSSLRSLNAMDPKRKKKWIMLGSVVAALVLALVIGLAVGLSKSNSSSGSSSESSSGSDTSEVDFSMRLSSVMNFLVEEGVSDPTALETAGTPQQLAANFVAKSNPEAYPVPASLSASDAFPFIQRYVLTVFFHALGGSSWRNNLHFTSNTNECLWYAIAYSTSGDIFRVGVQCNTSGRLIALRISGNNLQGAIPEEIGFLTDLKVLGLHFNAITTLPDSIMQLSNLEWLSVHYNRLKGPIPTWLGKLPKLRTLALSNNEFSGPIPPELGSLTEMDILALDDNKLTGGIGVLKSMTKMRRLYLEDNQFTGTIDSDFLVEMPNLEELDLSDNLFEGTVPLHLLSLDKLTVLDLHDNALNFSLPENIPVNNALTLLALQGNQISDSIPDSIGNLKALTHLDLTSNKFSGPIPAVLRNMTTLAYLFLADNDFEEGDIPEFLQDLTGLQELSLKRTHRTGPIPDWIGGLTGLVLLDLDDNRLEGPINPVLGDLSELRFLLLNRNKLDGGVPEEFLSLTELDMLLLQENQLTGTTGQLGCEETFPISVFVTDCVVTCDCCSLCCGDNGECKDEDFLATNDPIWERGYGRDFFVFSEETTFDKETLIRPP